ncbi:MAG TPA: KTSC domain-containing protein [Ramlibacter sp.]|nr:KTSC domain-containing protein [Ramlibacter sp.]
MRRHHVTSSAVLSIGYEPQSRTLEVQFANGIYRYHRVPESVYRSLMAAESKGRFVNLYIKPVYRFTQVD